ncbi:hypothetical protein MNB_SV-10-108 [hydrothermal vent metagenome]|uniref:Uncharacterized protein n=1 Tax=hydrothermal vent metagenome TaxID=652676 RepID=A0A1W1C0Z5_9ZZZZ
MKGAVQEKQASAITLLNPLLSFSLSEKFKFAVKVSLSIMLVYLIAFAQGWSNASTAAIAIMLIAVAGPVTESVIKGLRRVAGTIIGAIVGMILIGLFPQDRELYLFFLSIFVTAALYLTRAYKGDTTIFMLTAVTMMMVFKNGEVNDVFLYGIDRTFMTILGIAVFTFIGIFLWPVKIQDTTLDLTGELLGTQAELYQKRDGDKTEQKRLYGTLQTQEEELKNSVVGSASDSENLNREQRNTIMRNIRHIDETLMMLSYHDETAFAKGYSHYVKNFAQADAEIMQLFTSLARAIKEQKEIDIPAEWQAKYKEEAVRSLSHMDRADLTAAMLDIKKLHEQLRALAVKFNAILSPYPTRFELSKITTSSFNWWDIEDLKGTLITFLIFWATVILWITVNPPGGFLIVTLATTLSVLTTYSPLKPSLLIILFSFSFIFAAAMYILVLPHIHYGWELGLFLFFYAFIGFYFIHPQIAIFFLLGIAILNLNNPMYFSFQLFLITLLVFYLFLFILLLFYYLPFSTKPEVLFLTMKQRVFSLSSDLLGSMMHTDSFLHRVKAWYAQKHLMNTAKKMQLWAGKIDTKYFNTIDQKTLLAFTKECENFVYLLQMMYRQEGSSVDKRLIQHLKEEKNPFLLADITILYAQNKSLKDLENYGKEPAKIIDSIEAYLTEFFSQMKVGEYSQEEIIHFYELIALRRNVWVSFFHCQNLLEKLDLKVLESSRF